VAEKRSLFDFIFGKPKEINNVTSMKMLNGFTPYFNNFSGYAYDSDVVRSAIDAIARNAAKLNAKHVRNANGNVNLPNSNIERLLTIAPNPHMDAYQFLYKVVTQLMVKNNAFVMIDWDKNGTVKGFYPLNASSVEFLENDKQIFVRFLFLGGQRVVLPYTDIIHLRRFFYKNDMYGETSDNALNPTLELINTTNQGIINAVKSSASLRGLLKFQSMLKPDDMKKQRDSFITDYLDVSNNGGIAATDAKADYVPLTNDPKVIDQKTMEFIDDKVFRYYGVSANIIKSTYSEEEWNAFYESVIEPIAIQLSLQFTSKLFSDREQGFGNQIIFESDRLQYASNKTKISLVETLMDRGLISINEGRSIFNMAPVEGGEKRLVSLNYVDSNIQNDYQMGGEKVVTQK
jgi:hypothetical protein